MIYWCGRRGGAYAFEGCLVVVGLAAFCALCSPFVTRVGGSLVIDLEAKDECIEDPGVQIWLDVLVRGVMSSPT